MTTGEHAVWTYRIVHPGHPDDMATGSVPKGALNVPTEESITLEKLGTKKNPPLIASAVEFVLEGLHLKKRLNKDKVAGRYQYRG